MSTNETTDAVPMVRLAEMIGKSDQTVRAWIRRGQLPAAFREHKYLTGNARWMVPADAAKELVQEFDGDSTDFDQFVEQVRVGDPAPTK